MRQKLPVLRAVLGSAKMHHGMLRMARFDEFPAADFKIAGNFVSEKFAIILVGAVTVTESGSGAKRTLTAGECFGMAPRPDRGMSTVAAASRQIGATHVITQQPTDILIFTRSDFLRLENELATSSARKKLEALSKFPEITRWHVSPTHATCQDCSPDSSGSSHLSCFLWRLTVVAPIGTTQK
jgi:hypothetical protein